MSECGEPSTKETGVQAPERGEPSTQEAEENEKPEGHKITRMAFLEGRLKLYLAQIPVIGFSSGQYDINVIKNYLLPTLVEHVEIGHLIKKGNAYFSIPTNCCRFLDIQNYLAPGYSYDKFLKAYLTGEQYAAVGGKGEFPYEAVAGSEWLLRTEFPSKEDFASKLKGTNMSEEKHQKLKEEVWDAKEMQNYRDLCSWYLEQDVVPFVKAVGAIFEFWNERKLDPFKQALSLPGITLNYLFSLLEHKTFFCLSGSQEVYDFYHSNLVGGPSIIFPRIMRGKKARFVNWSLGTKPNFAPVSKEPTPTPCTFGRPLKRCRWVFAPFGNWNKIQRPHPSSSIPCFANFRPPLIWSWSG